MKGLLKQGNHLVTRVKSNAVAYLPVEPRKGRSNSLLTDHNSMQQAIVNLYGECGVKVRYCTMKVLISVPVARPKTRTCCARPPWRA